MNTALRFPSPGQRLTADFGRQLARNINSLRITGGPGVRVTQGPNGVTISAASQGGGGSSSAPGDYFPFRLSAYMDADSGKHYAVVMTNDGSVQILPGGTGHRFATAENAEATMAVENGWRLVAGAFSCAKDAKTEAVTTTVTSLATLEDYEWDKNDPRFDVYAVIYRTADETYSFVVTDTLDQPGAIGPLGEDAFVACVYVGTFQRTYDEDTEQYSYGVSNQVLRSALVLREEADEEELYPFKLKRVNEGTEDAPDWKTVVYLPDDAVQHSEATKTTNLCAAATDVGDGWYYVDDSDADSATVYLSVNYWCPPSKSLGSWGYRVQFIVSTKKAYSFTLPSDAFDGTSPDATGVVRVLAYRRTGIAVGAFDETQNTTENVMRSSYVVDYTTSMKESSGSSSESGGGGDGVGTYVSVTEADAGAAATALVVADATSSGQESVTFTKYGLLESSAVKVDTSDGNAVTLGDYIASEGAKATYGDVDATLSGSDSVRAPFNKYEDEPSPTYGANINTKNFETLCLQSNPTSEVVVGSERVAARADHKHFAEDIYYTDENDKSQGMFSNIDAFLEYIESLKEASGDGSGEGGETAEDVAPKDTRLVTYGDLLKENTATQGADGIGTDKAETPLQDDSSKTAGVNENVLAEATLKELTIDQQSWDRATDETGKGFTYSVCCGVKYIPSKYGVYLVFRDVSVDKYGMVCKVSAAKFALYYPVVV